MNLCFVYFHEVDKQKTTSKVLRNSKRVLLENYSILSRDTCTNIDNRSTLSRLLYLLKNYSFIARITLQGNDEM